MPADFLREGTLFMNRCTSTMRATSSLRYTDSYSEPDKKEFIRISQAIGIGFLIMGPSSIARHLKVCQLANPSTRSYWLHRQARTHSRKQHPRGRLINSLWIVICLRLLHLSGNVSLYHSGFALERDCGSASETLYRDTVGQKCIIKFEF